jgi:hypothetical protein
MINKKLLVSTALAGLLAASNAFSQTTNFVGPSLALTGSYVGGSSNFKTGDFVNQNILYTDQSGLNTRLGENTNIIPGVDLNYGFAMGNNFVLGLGATYDFSKTKTGGFNSNLTVNGDDFDIAVDSSFKKHYSLYIEPTYVVNKETALFAKVGRHYAKANISAPVTVNGSSLSDVTMGEFGGLVGQATATSKNIEGWGYGVGIKTFLTSNLFVQLDAGIVEYDKVNLPYVIDSIAADEPIQNSYKAKTTNATISVGYKF